MAVTVRANLEVGMKLVKKPSTNDNIPLVYVTAIGEKNILAIDDKGTEHKIPFDDVDNYMMAGWK